jgi:hypothetical protein
VWLMVSVLFYALFEVLCVMVGSAATPLARVAFASGWPL